MNRDYFLGSWKKRGDVVTTIAPVTEWTAGTK